MWLKPSPNWSGVYKMWLVSKSAPFFWAGSYNMQDTRGFIYCRVIVQEHWLVRAGISTILHQCEYTTKHYFWLLPPLCNCSWCPCSTSQLVPSLPCSSESWTYNSRNRTVITNEILRFTHVYCATVANHTVASFHRLNVAYNNVLRRLLRRPRFCSASGLFAECRIPNCKAVIRNLIFRFMTRLDLSTNSIICTILASDIRWTFRIRRHWVKSLYVHHDLVWQMLLSCMCYYCLVLKCCNSMCMGRHMYAVPILCVRNKHLSIYLSTTQRTI